MFRVFVLLSVVFGGWSLVWCVWFVFFMFYFFLLLVFLLFFFFSSRGRHTRLTCDWSSDVCSSDLGFAKVGLARLSQIRGYFLRRRAVNISWNTRAWIDETIDKLGTHCSMVTDTTARHDCCILRSEERRVGKEWRSGWWLQHENDNE